MDTFFNLLRKGLVLTFLVIFAFVVTYSPVSKLNTVNTAYAVFPVADGPSLAQMLIDAKNWALEYAQIAAININTAYTTAKNMVGDGIVWVIAKIILTHMLRSMIDWVNSGFDEGRPMFVEDLGGFLTETADRVFGEYIASLGSAASFLCEPFRLDIQIALSLQYQTMRDWPAPTCTLSGIAGNIEDFLDGAQGGFSANGGWQSWFTMVSQPEVYTPYGAQLEAQAGLSASIRNAQGEEMSLLDFGRGFMSAKECEQQELADGTTNKVCTVITPGDTIAKALSSNIDSGRESLVAADEIGELLDQLGSALLGQVANTVFGRGKGLLGA